MKIMESTNYEMFVLHDFNRDLHDTSCLEKSMKAHGFLNDCPIAVKKEGGKFKIIRGHHRFAAARKLGIAVKYVFEDADIHPAEDARTIKLWSLHDYLNSYSAQGKTEYIKVRQFQRETGISLSACVAMLGGQEAGSGGNYANAFKCGTYKVKDTGHAEAVASVVLTMTNSGIKWATASLMVQAVSKIVASGHADIGKLKQKIRKNPSMFEKKQNLQQYLDLLEEVYNRNSKTKYPLAFLASEASKKRQATFGRI